jgi:hypothetical protein
VRVLFLKVLETTVDCYTCWVAAWLITAFVTVNGFFCTQDSMMLGYEVYNIPIYFVDTDLTC